MNIVQKARIFSIAAHSACGQVRKHSQKPYYTHPQDVVDLIRAYVDNPSDEMLAAAYLHDVVEDTKVGMQVIIDEFGYEVAKLVVGMTKLEYSSAGSPAKRKDKFHLEVFRLYLQTPDVKTLKLADSICNMRDFINENPEYARKVYLPEKRILLDEALKEGDEVLWTLADKLIKDFMEQK